MAAKIPMLYKCDKLLWWRKNTSAVSVQRHIFLGQYRQKPALFSTGSNFADDTLVLAKCGQARKTVLIFLSVDSVHRLPEDKFKQDMRNASKHMNYELRTFILLRSVKSIRVNFINRFLKIPFIN